MLIDGQDWTFSVPQRVSTIGELRQLIENVPDTVELQDADDQPLFGTIIFADEIQVALILQPLPEEHEEE